MTQQDTCFQETHAHFTVYTLHALEYNSETAYSNDWWVVQQDSEENQAL